MLIGYARISTDDQNLNLQKDALQQAGCEKIYSDRISGAKAERPGLSLALEVARTGDVLVVWRLDRLGRSLKDLISMMETLDKRGIGLSSLQESITTTNNSGIGAWDGDYNYYETLTQRLDLTPNCVFD
jgi:DNA invertase Pin-like site-specific DNA recombinase